MTSSLVARLAPHLTDEHRARLVAGTMEPALADALRAARAAWPTLSLADEEFLPHLARRMRGDRDPVAALGALRVVDLYLACACERAVAGALEAFDAKNGIEVRAALRRMRLGDADVEELQQLLRTQLFLPSGDAPPKIAEYSGSGDLRSWVRVVVVRMGLRALRQRKAQPAGSDEALGAVPAAGDDPEIEYLKRTHGRELEEALREAWKALPVRSRLLLRQYFKHGLTVDEIGVVHRVGRSTAARWVTAAREDLVARTREGLMRRLAVGRPEVASILRLVESQLASKVADLLGPSVDTAAEAPADGADPREPDDA